MTFLRNRCDNTGPDLGGAAVRVLSQFEGRPVTVSGSTSAGFETSGYPGIFFLGAGSPSTSGSTIR